MFSEKNMMNTLFVAALALEKFDAANNSQQVHEREYQDNNITGNFRHDGQIPSLKRIRALAQRSDIAPAAVAAILAARRCTVAGNAYGGTAGPGKSHQVRVNNASDCHALRKTHGSNHQKVDELACDSDCESTSNTISLDIDDDDMSNSASSIDGEAEIEINDEKSLTNSRSIDYFIEAAAVVPQQQRHVDGESYETLVWTPKLVIRNDRVAAQIQDISSTAVHDDRRCEKDKQANSDKPSKLPLRRLTKLLDCASLSSFMASAGSHDLAIERVYRKLYECDGAYKATLDALMSPLDNGEFEWRRQKLSADENMTELNDDDAATMTSNEQCAVVVSKPARRS